MNGMRCRYGLVLVLTLGSLAGCTRDPPTPPVQTAPAGSPADRTFWEAYYIEGVKIGYGRVTIGHGAVSEQPVVTIEGFNHLAITRFGQETRQEIRFTSTETPEGALLSFRSEISMDQTPMVVEGRVEGDRLLMETTTQGKTVRMTMPWSADYGGFYAPEQSLAQSSLAPGQRRSMNALVAGFNQVAAIEMTAGDYETVSVPEGTRRLLRVNTTTTFPNGQTLGGALWVDRRGEVVKNRSDAMGLVAYRVPKAQALTEDRQGHLDLGWDIAVPVDRPLAHPHETKRVRYRVSLQGGDPATVFASGPSQRIKPTGPHTAEVTVYALRPDGPAGNPDASEDAPSDDDRTPNNLIQSDDPQIVAMAEEAVGSQKDPWKAAVALERYVNGAIAEKGFSKAFASASEVAKTREGDCTEHAVLLAALARARGIPARVVIGLVYMEDAQAFGYHMWNELYVAGRWIPMDATLARGGIGAAHLKLAHSNLKGADGYSSFLPVAQAAGRLRIEIEERETKRDPKEARPSP